MFLFAAGLAVGCGGKQPADVGVAALAPCPDTPNCVSSLAPETSPAYIEPFVIVGAPEVAWTVLISVLENSPRTKVVQADNTAIHAEATSFLFRFVDDVEFRLHPHEARIDVRSASRKGRSDLGVNRRRVEKLRDELMQQGVVAPGTSTWEVAP